MPERAVLLNETPVTKQSDLSLVCNNVDRNIKVLTDLQRELRRCSSFDFSVAFITRGGLATILQYLDNTRNTITGRILTTDYLNFSEPQALRTLLSFKNIQVRMYTKDNFHTKGYMFYKDGECTLLIGSSNLTQGALSVNKEWNVLISSETGDSAIITETKQDFESMWSEAEDLTEAWIKEYEPRHLRAKIERDKDLFTASSSDIIVPNEMQEEALVNLSKLRNENEHKALLVSATGTGKTFLSAFDVKNANAKKVLFLVHREQILDDARRSFEQILGSGIKTGKIAGSQKDFDADYIFSTTQSMTREDTLNHFSPDYFDYIICDEAHHSISPHYRRIIEYFHPKFMLGMTATPERMDSGDIFELFNHKIAYEIRLQTALKHEMLCPFHYYGITDIEIDGVTPNDEIDFNRLTSDERIKHIIEKAEFYGYSGDRVKGLIFCRDKAEGRMISEKMNLLGKRTIFLCDQNSNSERESVVKRLEQVENNSDALDYIVTVDLFNEGVDIRSVNQIIMLRPTQSSIVFIQQLGRGLRKLTRDNQTKEFLVVLDFIGNYRNNFMIPLALSEDYSSSKESLRKYLMSGTNTIPGCSTVDFDRISEKRIYESINKTKSLSAIMKDDYRILVKMLGYAPDLRYLQKSKKIFPPVLISNYKSLNNFKKKLKLASYDFNKEQNDVLEYLSDILVNGMRPFEATFLKDLVEVGSLDIDTFKTEVKSTFNLDVSDETVSCCVRIFNGKYAPTRYSKPLIVSNGNSFEIDPLFKEMLSVPGFKESLEDVYECSSLIFNDVYKDQYDSVFSLFQRYSRKDVVRLLNWTDDDKSAIFGYMMRDYVCPIFVTYNKRSDISKSTQYEDKFISPSEFSWFTKSKVRIDNSFVINILKPIASPYLFVQKGDDDSSDFYYMGKVTPILDSVRETTQKDDNGQELPIVNIHFKLSEPVPESLYRYITESNVDS